MKLAISFFVFCMMIGIHAAGAALPADGSSTLTLYPDNGSPLEVDLSQSGGKITGRGNFGNLNIINLTLQQNRDGGTVWTGSTATGLTKFSCNENSCDGFISSKSADFKIEGNGTFQGTFDGRLVHAVSRGNYLLYQGRGSIELNETSPGHFEGSGLMGVSPVSHFTATLEGRGSLAALNDPAIFLIYFASVFQ